MKAEVALCDARAFWAARRAMERTILRKGSRNLVKIKR